MNLIRNLFKVHLVTCARQGALVSVKVRTMNY